MYSRLECGPVPNVMAALPNRGGSLCSMPQRRKVWLTLTTRVLCSNAAKKRNPLKFAGCPKLPNRSQLLVGRSSPYCEDIWRCLTTFFPIVDTCLSCKDTARQSCVTVPRWRIFGDFFASCIFSEPRAAHFRPAFCIDNRLDNRLYRVYKHPTGCRLSNRLCNRFDNRLDVCIHDTTCCPTGCQCRMQV